MLTESLCLMILSSQQDINRIHIPFQPKIHGLNHCATKPIPEWFSPWQKMTAQVITLSFTLSHRIKQIMCVQPCATCSDENFYSCLSCSQTEQTLNGSICLNDPHSYFHIPAVALAIIFILPVLVRKRSLVLIKILDLIQLASYFKFIKGYAPNRQIWLYLNMRGWGDWQEGWQIINGDPTLPIWTNEEGILDKAIRIVSTWAFFIFLSMILGLLKVSAQQKNLTLYNYMRMNAGNALLFGIYFSLQDMAFLSASQFLNPSFNSLLEVISFAMAVVMSIAVLMYLFTSFYLINFKNQQKHFNYKYMFLLAADYDLYPTYELLEMPSTSKQIKKYSNIRILDMLKKIGYSFLIVAYVSDSKYSQYTHLDQIYQILAFLLFFELLWYVLLPFNIRREYLQFGVMIMATLLTVFLLFGPWYIDNALLHALMAMSMFFLALVSLGLEIWLDIYRLIPVDLYGIGANVIIKDDRLAEQLARRNKQQLEIEKKLKEMQERNIKLQQEMEARQKTNRVHNEFSNLNNQSQDVGELSNSQDNKELTEQELMPRKDPPKHFTSQGSPECVSMDSEARAEQYRLDKNQQRQTYQWNRQKPFSYSNTME